MVIGIDVGSDKHYFRAFNWSGIEATRKPVSFSNFMEEFNSFYNCAIELIQKNNVEEVVLIKGISYNASKMHEDIKRPESKLKVA